MIKFVWILESALSPNLDLLIYKKVIINVKHSWEENLITQEIIKKIFPQGCQMLIMTFFFKQVNVCI